MIALISFIISPSLALAQIPTVETSLTRDSTGGANPIVKAKWEMNADKGTDLKYLGTDAATTAGAQFMPSGQYQVGKTITVCGIITDPDGVADIDSVYSDLFYPTDISTGPNHEPDRLGCGQQMPEFTLTKLSKTDGIELFCNKIKNNNNNLPTFNTGFSYAEICALDGELWKETAYAYCGEITLSYEDPSGDYNTLVLAQDKSGKDGTLSNMFTYLPLTAFETDFTSVAYGRVGSDAAFVNYFPETTRVLPLPLNLSETDEMDFSIDISKFPPTHEGNNYVGTMVLSATMEAHLNCAT